MLTPEFDNLNRKQKPITRTNKRNVKVLMFFGVHIYIHEYIFSQACIKLFQYGKKISHHYTSINIHIYNMIIYAYIQS